jgi:hypothetical protein
MILNDYVELKINNRYIKYYKDKGYDVIGNKVYEIKIEDLPEQSHVIVDVKCDNCGVVKKIKYFNYILNYKNGNVYYCNDCKYIKIEKTNLERYGVKSTLMDENTKDKIKNTCIKKYGVDHYSKSDNFKDDMIKINNEKYGLDNYIGCDDFRKKSRITCLKKYGFEHYSKSKDFKKNIKSTCLKKYGVDHYAKTQSFKEIIKNNVISKYKNKYNIDIKDIKNNILTIVCVEGHDYNIHKWLLKNRLIYGVNTCTICNPINSFTYSDAENKLLDFIKSNYDGNIITNDRKFLDGKELDIYLPDLNIAFEFNGLFWHNELYKEKSYHLNKTELCLKKDVQLIHIWEDDWKYKQEIVKSMILNKLGKNQNKIFARKCDIREITDNRLIKEFLINNHIQGYVNSFIKLGLFYNNELVSLMIFGKNRKFMNSLAVDNKYELLRFCNKINTNVIGGASKLFKYFTNNYKYSEIITYADRCHSMGKLYNILGFEYVSKSEPNYYYVVDGIRKHRFGFRKDVLIREGYDKNKSEHEIMFDRKLYRIYDSGILKYSIQLLN